MSVPAFELKAQKQPRSRRRLGGWSWGPVEGAKLRVLSLGVGVQSTTLALMAAHGEIGPMPDCAIAADTQDEGKAFYEQLHWLQSGNVLPFPVKSISAGRLSDRIRSRAANDLTKSKEDRFVSIPTFTGRGGQGRRQCTRDFKVDPLTAEQRRLMGFTPRQRVPPRSCEIWIGISTDEVVRAGASYSQWAVNRFPLLELRMSRSDCERWLDRHGYHVPPKSACVFCPYRTNAEWRWLRDNDPDAWASALEVDAMIRSTSQMRHTEYLHRSLKPLGDVDLSTAEDNGQGMLEVCDAGCGL